MTTEPDTTLEPDNENDGADAIDPVEHEAILVELGVSDETIDATPEEIVLLIARLVAQANTAEEGRMRALADFRNFQRRSIENEGRAKKEGLSGVVRSLLPALDHFDLALQSVGASATIEQVVTGVGMVRGEIVRALESNGVTIITADPGAAFEPGQHEAVGVKPFEAGDENLEAGSVAINVSPGYAMGDVVLRPAKVMLVAEPPTA
ncbi:MAG: nucleotide exchange factor GrpE [Planctomycetia bacterium]|jgi:molecular chaperone GrpE|nr:nucleotide exchange factor GrpE [Planctomycetia bacterium]